MYLCGIFAWHFVIIYIVKPINDEFIMKKNLLLFLLLTLMSFMCADLYAQEEVVIDENFSAFTEGSESKPATTDISGYSGKLYKTIGWNGSKVYEAGGMLKVADGGKLTTPYMRNMSKTSNIKVTFDVRSLADYGGGVVLKLGYSKSETFFVYDSEWHTMTAIFENASPTNSLEFNPYLAAEGILIDNVKVIASDDLVAAPEALQPLAADETSFTARWKSVSGATYLLDVYTKGVDGAKDYLVKDREETGTSALVEGLVAGNVYYYTVRAKKGETVSDYSNEIEVVEVLESVDAPKALPATNVTETGFTANWEAVAKATRYMVQLTRIETLTESKSVNILDEDFSKVDKGTLTNVDFISSSDIDSYTKVPGWSTYMECVAKGYMGISPYSDNGGFIKTPALNLSHDGGKFTVALNMAEGSFGTYYEGTNVEIRIYNGDSEEPVETKTVVLAKNFKDYTLEFAKGTEGTYVEVYYNGNKKLFVDYITVSQVLSEGDVYSSVVEDRELENVTSTTFEVPLTESVSYSYQVVAYARTVVDGEIDYMPSAPSDVVNVKLTSSSIDGVQETTDNLKVYAENGGVVVELAADAVINVYNAAGQQTASVSGRQGANHISVASGLNIVKVGAKSAKVLVR